MRYTIISELIKISINLFCFYYWSVEVYTNTDIVICNDLKGLTMKLIKNFISGYGKGIELFPKVGSIDDDWRAIGEYLQISIKEFQEISNEEREKYQKSRAKKTRGAKR